MQKQFIFGEFFSGAGGLSLGAINALRRPSGQPRMMSAWAVDKCRDACASYHRNIHGGMAEVTNGGQSNGRTPIVINSDVRSVDVAALAPVDAFLFGFPCNDFSSIGETRGLDGDFGPLYRQGIRLLAAKNPLFFVAENVSGLIHANGRQAFATIMNDLRMDALGPDLSYEVTPHLYKFEDYGIPQTRHRIMIIGIRSDVARNLPRPFMPPAPEGRIVTAGEALSSMSQTLPNNEPAPENPRVTERLKFIAPGQNIWDVNDTLPEHLRINAKGARISTIYKVVDPAKPAYTVTASGGGGTYMYHWEGRTMTNRERARLQTFPDHFIFEGSRASVRRQIGMAVPPSAAEKIISAVLMTLDGTPYDAVQSNLS